MQVMKKIFSLLILILVCINANAVLKEKNLGHTLHVLRLELKNMIDTQKENIKMMNQRHEAQHARLKHLMMQCETTSLILYSQGEDFTFDMAYACQEATMLYHKMSSETTPYEMIKLRIDMETARYDSLICALKQLPPQIMHTKDMHIVGRANAHEPFVLDKQGIEDRDSCIAYANILSSNLRKAYKAISLDQEHYARLTERIGKMNAYAQKKYADLQKSIFRSPGTNYFYILSTIPMQWKWMEKDFDTKYQPLREPSIIKGKSTTFKSQWRGRTVLFLSVFMIIYLTIGILLGNILVRFCVPRRFRTETFMKKRPVLIMVVGAFIFAFIIMILRTFIKMNLAIMATGLMIEVAWLVGVIFISMLIRLNGDQAKASSKIYTPFILMSIIVICFRIILIPNAMVSILFPPILLLFTIWQIIILRQHKKKVPLADLICCSVSLTCMIVSCILAWIGFTLMAVQILVWWMFQLAAIATITCIYDLMEMYESRILVKRVKKKEEIRRADKDVLKNMKRGNHISTTWLYDFINKALVPVCGVYSILFSVIMAAEIFDLRALCYKWFFHEWHVANLITVSVFKVFIVFALYFIFKYFNYLIRSSWFGLQRSKSNKNFNATLSRNIIAIIIWGIYIIVVFYMLNVPSKGIALVTTGLSTGLGFASKSLLENFFYGISLMTGRVRVGDYIECDGMIGKVESITYQSTQIITLDGSVVAILNSDLFSKNFKNLTRNHQYVLEKIPVGVAYGTNINKVREMLTEGINKICIKTADGRDIVDPKHGVKVSFSGFGESSVNLFVDVWVLVDQKLSFVAEVNEKIYNILNENNIEIPFPQHDIYIHGDNIQK